MSHPDPNPSPGRARAGATLGLLLLVGVACAAGGYAAAVKGPGWLPARVTAPPAPEPVAEAPPAIDARLADIQARLIAQQAAEDQTDAIVVASAEVEALGARLARMEQRQDGALQAAAAALAIAALDQAAQGSGAFAPELAVVQRSAPPSPELKRLSEAAVRGAPSRAALAAAFPEAARRAVAAQQAGAHGEGWTARVLRAIAAVVTIRRLDPSGRGSDATLARAETRLNDGDLDGALSELQGLPATEREAMADWLGRARRRVEIDHDVAALRAQAVQRLGQQQAALAAAEPVP